MKIRKLKIIHILLPCVVLLSGFSTACAQQDDVELTGLPPSAFELGCSPDIVGTWWSPSCEAREYRRKLVLSCDGTFTATDLVSPCPPGAKCVWSGIIHRTGTWRSINDNRIDLETLSEAPLGRAAALPSSLEVDLTNQVLRDKMPGATTQCAYTRTDSVSVTDRRPFPLPPPEILSDCAAAIQDRVEWNYSGSSRWAMTNLKRICHGAEYSSEPGACFDRAMHGGIDKGDSMQWTWQEALALCTGTRDSNQTIACYQDALEAGTLSPQAIEACTYDDVAASE